MRLFKPVAFHERLYESHGDFSWAFSTLAGLSGVMIALVAERRWIAARKHLLRCAADIADIADIIRPIRVFSELAMQSG